MIHMISAILFATVVVVMAVGVILGRSPLRGLVVVKVVQSVSVMNLSVLNVKQKKKC